MTEQSARMQKFTDLLLNLSDLQAPLLFVVVLGMLVVPMPGWMLDMFLLVNIAITFIILLRTSTVTHALEFSVFPSLLLITTLFRLSINVSATRLILTNADADGAGKVIQAFGTFVIGNSPVAGIVIFTILIIIQFVVITAGAGRVAEVAARFTLDAMPGKQMAIDADLNAGLIDDVEARRRREDVSRESDFYGAMDGASKFVRGDAIAAIIMVIVNILGGFAVGMLIHKMELKQALNEYTMKTVGEGIVTQIPALIMSIATGLIVTRSTSKSHLSNDLVMQVLSNPHSLVVVSVIIALFAMVPGLPKFPILLVSGGLAALAIYQMRGGLMTKESVVPGKKPAADTQSAQKAPAPEDMMNLLAIDPIEIEVGYGLVALADPMQGGDLLERITTLRKQIAVDHGFIVPPVRVRDNIQLKSSGYIIKLWDVEVADGEIMMRYMLAMKPGEGIQAFPGGIPTTEPAFGLPAIWVSETQKFEAEMAGFTVVDPTTVLITHLSEVIKNHAYEILSRQDVQMLVDKTRSLSSALVDDLIPKQLSLSELHRVLQNLLKERVAIRDLNRILTSLSDHITMTHDIDMLTEYVRQSLARTITSQYRSTEGFLEVFTLEPSIEQMIVENLRQTQMGMQIVLDPMVAQKLLMKVKEQADRAVSMGYQPILLCSTQIRPYFRKLIEKYMPSLIVISHAEIVPGVQVKAIGTVTIN